MSTFNYGPISTKAAALIAKFGTGVALSKASSADPADAARPWRGPAAGTDTRTPKGVVTSFDKNEVNGDTIVSTDIKLLVAAADPLWDGFTQADMGLCRAATLNSIKYDCLDVSDVMPDGNKIVMTYRLRLT